MQKMNWWLDLFLFLFFGLLAWPQLTGVLFHEWLGLILSVLLVAHLWLHGAWFKKALTNWRLLSKTMSVRWLVDLGLGLTLAATLGTGFVLALYQGGDEYYSLFLDWHIIGTLSSLGLLLGKTILHQRWLVATFEKIVLVRTKPTKKCASLSTTQTSRRDFLKLSGLLAGGVLLGGYQLKEYLQTKTSPSIPPLPTVQPALATVTDLSSAQPTTPPQTNNNLPTVTAVPMTTESAFSNNCQVRCPKGCSFPGSCRRYTDNNQNQLCDLGECL